MGPRRYLVEEDSIFNFIKEVQGRECIWNTENECYSDRYQTMMAWKDIAQVMDLPEEVLKSKWRNLRDLFKRELRRWKNVDSLESYKGKWKFFSALWFIHKPGEVVVNDNEDDTNDFYDETYLEDDEENPLSSLVKTEPLEVNKQEEVYVEVNPLAPTRKRRREEDDDFDMMYLKSLTPYFRQLDPIRKLIVRSKMQDILLNELAAQQSQNNKKK